MTKTNNMTIARRLGLGFSFVGALALCTALAGAWGLRHSEQRMKTMYEDRTVPLQQLAQIQYLATRSRVVLMDAVMHAKPEQAAKRVDQYHQARDKSASYWKAYMATQLTPEEKVLAQVVAQTSQVLYEEGFEAMATALKASDFDRAREALNKKVSPLNPAFTEALDKLITLQVHVAGDDFAQSQVASSRAQWLMVALVLLAALGSTAAGVLITRNLMRALGAEPDELAAVAQRVADGALADDGKPRATPGSVMASMQAMRQSLMQVVSTVRGGVESVATASAQIAQGNADLSSRTEEQAANLEQTAASMEQLTGTVRSGADNARQANDLAREASRSAVSGGEVVARVVDTMSDIKAASQKIADITGVIDGIAFQTNILALNAAVEAARAGEQGRGFAVVATEVRTLAQRSADAARQIKNLIGDSVSKVDAGHLLVQDAGTRIDGVVTQVQRVSELIGQITAAASEQTQGIDQVGQAVTQLDQATQQNAALVEESAAAAESLKAQATRLSEAVAVFRLDARPA